MKEIIEAVKAYALANYENGWSTIIEAWSDDDIAESVGQGTWGLQPDESHTIESAIEALSTLASIWHDRELEAFSYRDY